MTSTIRFIHISDTHLGPEPEFELKGVPSQPRTEALLGALEQLPDPFDFVVHTGDMATDADKTGDDDRSTARAAKLFSRLRHPLYLVNGNHDDRQHLARHFGAVAGDLLEPEGDTLSRARHWQFGGERFVILDARPDFECDPAGSLPRSQLAALDRLFEATTERVTVFLHYPPLAMDAWFDDRLLIDNGEDLHDLLRRRRERLRGVFFGHIHRSLQIFRDGVFYCAVGATSCNFHPWRGIDDDDRYDRAPVAFYNYVSLTPTSTIVKQHAVPEPTSS